MDNLVMSDKSYIYLTNPVNSIIHVFEDIAVTLVKEFRELAKWSFVWVFHAAKLHRFCCSAKSVNNLISILKQQQQQLITQHHPL